MSSIGSCCCWGDDAKSARQIEYDGLGVTESGARSAFHSLGGRGLVDVAGWDDYNRRTYRLTTKGRDLLRDLVSDMPTCPHGCARLAESGGDFWLCPVCGDEWDPATFEDEV